MPVPKSKIIKILNNKENSKWRVPYQIAKSKAQTHQTNGQQLYSHFYIVIDIIFFFLSLMINYLLLQMDYNFRTQNAF